MATKYPFPELTKAQRTAMDRVGCGEYRLPGCKPETIRALLEAGVIVQSGEEVVCRDRFGTVTAPSYAMPIPIHYQWCEWRSEQYERAGHDLGGEG